MCIWYGAKTQVADTALSDVKVFSQLTLEGYTDNLNMPILLLNGEEDVTISKQACGKITSLSKCRQTVIPGAGHYLVMEKPEKVAEAVKEFLGEIL